MDTIIIERLLFLNVCVVLTIGVDSIIGIDSIIGVDMNRFDNFTCNGLIGNFTTYHV